jgi:hypothetical protein
MQPKEKFSVNHITIPNEVMNMNMAVPPCGVLLSPPKIFAVCMFSTLTELAMMRAHSCLFSLVD